MQDRPTAIELLDAIERFLRTQSGEQADRWLRFQLLVAANSLGIVRRELELEEPSQRQEWQLLDGLLGEEPLPPTFGQLTVALRQRMDRLCAAIRAGAFDDPDLERALLAYFVTEVTNRVRITAPNELA